MISDGVVSGVMLPLWEEVLWPFLDAWDSVRLCTTSSQWNVPGRYGPYGELFFFLSKKEPMVIRELARFWPSIWPHGELLFSLIQKKPAFVPDSEAFNSFIGGGFLVPELKGGSEASDDVQADNVGNEALYVIGVEAVKACALVGLHMMAEEDPWRSDSGSPVSSSDSCDDTVGNDALHVIGLHRPSSKISLFLQDRGWFGF